MAKMSKAQRMAILDFHRGVTAKGHTLLASARTIAVLVRNGWARYPEHVTASVAAVGRVRVAYVTRAGLIAAGVDLDGLHAKALVEMHLRNASAKLADRVGDERRRLLVSGHRERHGRIDLHAWNNVMDAIHAEALAEYREATRAARQADSATYQRELARELNLNVKGDPNGAEQETVSVQPGMRVDAMVNGRRVTGRVTSTAYLGTTLLSIGFYSPELGHSNYINDAILVQPEDILTQVQ
jgi:hypothetical protein